MPKLTTRTMILGYKVRASKADDPNPYKIIVFRSMKEASDWGLQYFPTIRRWTAGDILMCARAIGTSAYLVRASDYGLSVLQSIDAYLTWMLCSKGADDADRLKAIFDGGVDSRNAETLMRLSDIQEGWRPDCIAENIRIVNMLIDAVIKEMTTTTYYAVESRPLEGEDDD